MYVRHAARYVRASMEAVVSTFLDEFGWCGPNVPFGAQPVTVMLRPPKQAELKPVSGNVVFISHGDEADYEDMQLGGGLLRVEHVLFVDILAENDGIALAIAADLKDRLAGLIGGTRFLRPTNPATDQALPGFLGEFDDVVREQPNPDLGAWQSVKATLVLDFGGDQT